MIRLKDLLFEYDREDNRYDEEQPERDERSTWRIEKSKKYGAKNSTGQIRYFDDETNARKFASGEIEGPNPGRPEPKQKPEKALAKDKYDIR